MLQIISHPKLPGVRMTTKKETSRARVQKWRDALRARGGKEIRLALEKESVQRLEKLQKYYENADYATVVSLALRVLDKTKSLFKPDSILEEKTKGEVGKE
jgi:hypothetical protein